MVWTTIAAGLYVVCASAVFATAGLMTIENLVNGRTKTKLKWSRHWAEATIVLLTIFWPIALVAALYEIWKDRRA